MPTNFPTSSDDIQNDITNATVQADIHPGLHNQLADAVMAIETELLAGGTMNLAAHVAAADPHSIYLTQAEAGALYQTPAQAAGLYLPLTGGTLAGNLLFSADNTRDIGASGANRPRNLYLAGTATVPILNTPLLSPTGNVVEQRNGTSGQQYLLYRSYVDASNYSRLRLEAPSSPVLIVTEALGTGTQLALVIGTNTTGDLFLRTQGVNAWRVRADGFFLAATDNTFDIGAPGASRPRNLYLAGTATVGTSVVTPALRVTAPGAFVAADKYLVVDASGNVHVSAIGPAS